MKRADAERLFAENTKLAYSMIHRYYPTFAHDEDIHQEALLGLWQACLSFDKNKSQFSTYAGTCILNRVRRALKNRLRQPDMVSLSAPIGDDNTSVLEDVLEDPYPGTDVGKVALKIFLEGLSGRDRKLIAYKAEGLTQRQIARKLGLSQTIVNRDLKRLRQQYLEQEDQE